MTDKMTLHTAHGANITIRRLVVSDFPSVIELGLLNSPDDKRVAQCLPLELEDMFSGANYRPTFFVAEHDWKIVGFAAWNCAWHNYDVYELFRGNVALDYRGMGIGRRLVEARISDIAAVAALESHATQSYVTVSTPHREMYQRYGFSVIAAMNLWQAPETYLMMRQL